MVSQDKYGRLQIRIFARAVKNKDSVRKELWPLRWSNGVFTRSRFNSIFVETKRNGFNRMEDSGGNKVCNNNERKPTESRVDKGT